MDMHGRDDWSRFVMAAAYVVIVAGVVMLMVVILARLSAGEMFAETKISMRHASGTIGVVLGLLTLFFREFRTFFGRGSRRNRD